MWHCLLRLLVLLTCWLPLLASPFRFKNYHFQPYPHRAVDDSITDVFLSGDAADRKALNIRGGTVSAECGADSNAVVAAKMAANAALETGVMIGLMRATEVAAPRVNKWLGSVNIPSQALGLPLLQWMSTVFVVFSSSTLASWIKGGVSAATNQTMKPNVVPGDSDWYSSLKKPWFNPPGWLFPIMWLIVSKPTQLVAVRRLLLPKSPSTPVPYWPALTVYCAHLSLGDAWNEVFFGCQRVGLGAYVIGAFYAMLLTSAKLIYDVDKTAGKCMLPTCGWVTIATALNISIYSMNRNGGK